MEKEMEMEIWVEKKVELGVVRRGGVEERSGFDKGGEGLMVGRRSGWLLVFGRRGRDIGSGW